MAASKRLFEQQKLEDKVQEDDVREIKISIHNTFNNTWIEDFPYFIPDFSPLQMFDQGIFGGAYFREGIVESESFVNHVHKQFIAETIQSMTRSRQARLIYSNTFNVSVNKYKVDCGGGYDMWIERGWIHRQDPFGWVNWYINFYYGRRSEDDERQIKRWIQFKKRHSPRLYSKHFQVCNEGENLKTRQNLLHWAINPLLIAKS